MPREETVFIGLGSNRGDRVANLRAAIQLMSAYIRVEKISNLYVAAPLGYVPTDAFVNAVLKGATTLKAFELLTRLKQTEQAMGRPRGTHFPPYVIDLDILFYGNAEIDMLELKLPHPRIAERAFVLKPLAEIAPNFMHPVLFATARQLLSEVEGADQVKLFAPE
jgi:2-amino-4-hydroxy-6-hydroxymethyldihydropteridine diphosphokinase